MSTDLTKTFDAIEARRSVRKYDPNRTIDEETMKKILECAMSAPTAVNSREWRFVVVRDQETRTKISQALPYCKFSAEPTATCICVCAEVAKEHAPGHWPQDCGAACHAMLIGAAAQGVGSTWTSLLPFEEVCFIVLCFFYHCFLRIVSLFAFVCFFNLNSVRRQLLIF